MRILYLMTEPFGIGGVQSDLLALSQDLTARGHEVYVATTPGVLLDELRSRGARFVNIDFHFREPIGLMRSAAALRRVVREHQIEIVAPQSVRSSIAAWLSLRVWPGALRRIPIITTIHNIHTPFHFRYAGKILRRTSDFVIFESHYESNRVQASGLPAERCCVVHSGIDTDRFAPQPRNTELLNRLGLDPERHFIFGNVARLSEEKGHNFLLEAFARVLQQREDARLIIVGDGPLRDALHAQAEALGIMPAVIFAGQQRNIPDWLSIFDVFVLTSTRESFPLAAREAMAAGRAVIAPRIGGCPEVVDDGRTGLLFPAANVDELTRCMLEIASERRHERFGAAGRQRVIERFSRRSWVDGDEAIYLRWLTA